MKDSSPATKSATTPAAPARAEPSQPHPLALRLGCLRQVFSGQHCKQQTPYTSPALPSPAATPQNVNQSKTKRDTVPSPCPRWQQSPAKPVPSPAILGTAGAEQGKTQPEDQRNGGLELLDETLCIFFVLSHLHPLGQHSWMCRTTVNARKRGEGGLKV